MYNFLHTYSGTSLNKPSELRTQQKKTFIISTKILVPTDVTDATYIAAKNGQKYLIPKCPL